MTVSIKKIINWFLLYARQHSANSIFNILSYLFNENNCLGNTMASCNKTSFKYYLFVNVMISSKYVLNKMGLIKLVTSAVCVKV